MVEVVFQEVVFGQVFEVGMLDEGEIGVSQRTNIHFVFWEKRGREKMQQSVGGREGEVVSKRGWRAAQLLSLESLVRDAVGEMRSSFLTGAFGWRESRPGKPHHKIPHRSLNPSRLGSSVSVHYFIFNTEACWRWMDRSYRALKLSPFSSILLR